MPLLQLHEKSVIDSFKQDLRSIKFLAGCDYTDIEKQLDVLANPQKRRYEKRASAESIWKLFVKKSLADITTNMRGCDELCRYFDKFVSYENMLVALDKTYRDHVIHTIWVMLLGFYLKKNSLPFHSIAYSYHFGYAYEKAPDEERIKDVERQIREWEASLWCLIALTHDLGYPIEKTKEVNRTVSAMLNSFGFLRKSELEYGFTTVHQTAIDELLNIITSRLIWHPKGYTVAYLSGLRLDFAKTFEQLDHGIMSAYLVLMHLDFICDLWNFPTKDLVLADLHRAAQIVVASELLFSISSHTNKNCYASELGYMSDLLFLSDELEEYSRYSVVNDEWTNVLCRTEFACTEKSLDFKYVFESEYLGDIKTFFKKKVTRIKRRFELNPTGLTEMSVTCEDVRAAEHIGFTYSRALSGEKVTEAPSGQVHSDVSAFLE